MNTKKLMGSYNKTELRINSSAFIVDNYKVIPKQQKHKKKGARYVIRIVIFVFNGG